MPFCSKCDAFMDYDCAMGYGDYKCAACGHMHWFDEPSDADKVHDDESTGQETGIIPG